MTEEACFGRIYAAEWHAELCRKYGLSENRYDALRLHLTNCISADFFGVPRPTTDDEWIAEYERYMDGLFEANRDNPMTKFF